MAELSLNKFEREYSEEILEFEKETGKHAIWAYRITGNFKQWINQKDKSKQAKMIVNNPYNHITEFILNFYKEHHYFTKKRITEDYINQNTPPKNEHIDIKLEFGTIIRYHLKTGVLEKFSKKTYKINKGMIEV